MRGRRKNLLMAVAVLVTMALLAWGEVAMAKPAGQAVTPSVVETPKVKGPILHPAH